MSIDEFREMLARETFRPFVLKTRGGRAYPVTHRASAFIFDPYPSTVVVAVPGRGITLLDIASIEAVQFEHEAASGR